MTADPVALGTDSVAIGAPTAAIERATAPLAVTTPIEATADPWPVSTGVHSRPHPTSPEIAPHHGARRRLPRISSKGAAPRGAASGASAHREWPWSKSPTALRHRRLTPPASQVATSSLRIVSETHHADTGTLRPDTEPHRERRPPRAASGTLLSLSPSGRAESGTSAALTSSVDRWRDDPTAAWPCSRRTV